MKGFLRALAAIVLLGTTPTLAQTMSTPGGTGADQVGPGAIPAPASSGATGTGAVSEYDR